MSDINIRQGAEDQYLYERPNKIGVRASYGPLNTITTVLNGPTANRPLIFSDNTVLLS